MTSNWSSRKVQPEFFCSKLMTIVPNSDNTMRERLPGDALSMFRECVNSLYFFSVELVRSRNASRQVDELDTMESKKNVDSSFKNANRLFVPSSHHLAGRNDDAPSLPPLAAPAGVYIPLPLRLHAPHDPAPASEFAFILSAHHFEEARTDCDTPSKWKKR